MFLQVCICPWGGGVGGGYAWQGGGMHGRGHAWQGGMHCGGMHGRGCVHGRGGMHGRGCMAGGMHGRGHACRGAYVAGGVHDRGHACWGERMAEGGMHGRGHVWWGACMAGGTCMADTMRYSQWAGSMHPTGMHSCLNGEYTANILLACQPCSCVRPEQLSSSLSFRPVSVSRSTLV